jgi:hypothetical protein
MWPRIGLEDKFSASAMETRIGKVTKEKSLMKKPTLGRTTKRTEQMTPAGSGIGIDLYISESYLSITMLVVPFPTSISDESIH